MRKIKIPYRVRDYADEVFAILMPVNKIQKNGRLFLQHDTDRILYKTRKYDLLPLEEAKFRKIIYDFIRTHNLKKITELELGKEYLALSIVSYRYEWDTNAEVTELCDQLFFEYNPYEKYELIEGEKRTLDAFL